LASLESAGDALLLWTDAPASMQATRQSTAKVKRNIPPRSGLRSREDQPQQPVYSIQTRTTNREDRSQQGKGAAKRPRARRERDEAGSFLCDLRSEAVRERSSGRPNHVRRHTSRLAVSGTPLAESLGREPRRTMQRSERWAVFQVRDHNGQYGDIASPPRSSRDHGSRLTFL
jgi:hypothetical protein